MPETALLACGHSILPLMKKFALTLFLIGLATPAFSNSIVPTPEEVRQGYLGSLQEKLVQEVLADNFGGAKVIAKEIESVIGLKLTSSNIAPCGPWQWVGSTMTTIFPGGRVLGNAGNATWEWVDEKQRKFRIKWESGWIDDCTLSGDALTLSVINNAGAKFTFHRALTPEQAVAKQKEEEQKQADEEKKNESEQPEQGGDEAQ
jgi:hypothetical protein